MPAWQSKWMLRLLSIFTSNLANWAGQWVGWLLESTLWPGMPYYDAAIAAPHAIDMGLTLSSGREGGRKVGQEL